MTAAPDKPLASIYTFNFVVRADSWDEVVTILKDELDITKKHNSSDRQVNGLYLVSCVMNEAELTKSFYKKIDKSENIAIHSDGKSSSLYPKILEETRAVEEKLRWLLLYVSDAVEDYAKLLGYEKNEIVEKDKLDPITSRLSFEAVLALLEVDQSWARDGVNDEKMSQLLSNSTDFDSFKKTYIEKTTPKIIWESICDLVLQRSVKWETIAPKLKSIKTLRNKCAHFHTVTDDDLSQAKHLKTQIMNSLTRKRTYSSSNIRAFAELSKQMAETMRTFQETYYKDIIKLTDASFSAQQALAQLSNSMSPSLSDTAKSVTEMVNKIYAPAFNNDMRKITSSFGNLNSIDNSKDDVEESPADSNRAEPPVDDKPTEGSDSSKKGNKK